MTDDGFDEGKWDPEKVGYIKSPIKDYGRLNIQRLVELVLSNFDSDTRQDWLIFGAKWVDCNYCTAKRGRPCINMNDYHRYKIGNITAEEVRFVKWPHHTRIMYSLIHQRFLSLGFIVKAEDE